jgi:hypothetical protein
VNLDWLIQYFHLKNTFLHDELSKNIIAIKITHRFFEGINSKVCVCVCVCVCEEDLTTLLLSIEFEMKDQRHLKCFLRIKVSWSYKKSFSKKTCHKSSTRDNFILFYFICVLIVYNFLLLILFLLRVDSNQLNTSLEQRKVARVFEWESSHMIIWSTITMIIINLQAKKII